MAPKETAEDDSLKLPDNYLTPIYNPPDAIAKIFIVHPSHRYAGVFQPVGTGMKYQVQCLDKVHSPAILSANFFGIVFDVHEIIS